MNREELNKLTKEEIIEEYLELQEDNNWWQRRWKADSKTAYEDFKPRIDKAIYYIKENIIFDTKQPNQKVVIIPDELLEILGGGNNE